MFHSQSLSRKGPLAGIWVAAYCHKRLKKSQVTATDIPFSVDMIMQEELEVITYRVLGYFLLGIVRIYSKKVEYLFDDCNKVLIQVKGFVFSEAKKSKRAKAVPVTAPVSPITLPKRFELDEFELDVVDDDSGGSQPNQVPPEDITLRDDTWITERIGHYSLQTRWEDVTSDQYSTEPDYSTVLDIVPLNVIPPNVMDDVGENDHEVRSEDITAIALLEGCPVVTSTAEDDVPPHAMDIDVGVSITGAQTADHEAGAEGITATALLETCPVGSSIAEESVPPDVMDVDVGVTTSADQTNTEAIIETIRDSNQLEEEHLAGADQNDAAEVEEAPQVPNKEVDGTNHSDGEPMTAREVHISEKEQMTSCEETNIGGSIENLRGNVVLEKENANLENEKVGEAGGESPEERENLLETTPGTRNLEHDDVVLHPTNLELEATPSLKQTDEQGARTPNFMLVPTPALKERSRTKRKRKTCLFDETIVLPNSVIKRNINNYNDLVCKRKKVPHDALSVWRARRAPNLFLDPLINYSAPELLSLFDEKKLKASRTLKDANIPSVPEPAQENEVLNPEVILEDMEVCREVNEDVQVPVKVNVSEFQHDNEVEGIAPETPIRGSPSRRPFQSPTTAGYDDMRLRSPPTAGFDEMRPETPPTAGFDEMRPETPPTAGFDEMRPESPAGVANLEKEPSFLQEDKELSFTLMNEEGFDEMRPESSAGLANLEKEPSFLQEDKEMSFTLMNEEGSSSDGGQDNLHGWTGRTRSIMRHLHKTFSKGENTSEVEAVSLLQTCKGRTREESSVFFYEILVLKSRGFIDVEQKNPYGDVNIRKKSELDRAFGRASADAL